MSGRVRAGQHLPHGDARIVHEGQRLDQGEVDALVATHHHARGIALPAATGPPGAIGDTIDREPADVVARSSVLRPGIPQADHELHEPSGQPNRARSRPGGPAEMVAAAVREGRFGRRPGSFSRRGVGSPALASPLPLPGRHGPSHRRGERRGSRGAAARRPVTSARRRSGRRVRPCLGDGSLHRDHDVAEVRPAAGWEREPGRAWPCRGPRGLSLVPREGIGRQQRERQDVRRPAVAEVLRVQRRELAVVREDQADRRRRRRAGRGECGPDGSREACPADRRVDPGPHGQVDPPRSDVDRPRHVAGRPVTRPVRFPRRRRRAATRARRPCSAGTRRGCGTSRAAARRMPRGSVRGRAGSGRTRRTGRRWSAPR